MLVLSRKVDERIVIDENIVITVVSTRSGRVQLGIAAPNSVRIVRAEVDCNQKKPLPARAPERVSPQMKPAEV